MKESFALSQQGYRLQALADGDHFNNRSSLQKIKENSEAASATTRQTRFYMTTFTREKELADSAILSCRDRESSSSNLTKKSDYICDAFARKYNIHKKVRKLLIADQLFTTEPHS